MSNQQTPEQLRALLDSLNITFADCVHAFGDSSDTNPYVNAARAKQEDGELEIDDHAVVSESDDGCYVMAWIWVGADEVSDEADDDATEPPVEIEAAESHAAIRATPQNLPRVLCVSTGHLTADEASAFQDSDVEEHQIGRARRMMIDARGYGFMVYLVDEDDFEPHDHDAPSEGLNAVIEFAHRTGVHYIWFDRDSDPLSGVLMNSW